VRRIRHHTQYALALERRSFAPQEVTPADELAAVRREAEACTRCPLYGPATRLVFGEGPADASLVFVGEQPGDQEDLAGRPFVGPAGQVFDRALAAAGIARKDVYVTGAVKHFKFEPRGKRRIHSKPGANRSGLMPPLAGTRDCRRAAEADRGVGRDGKPLVLPGGLLPLPRSAAASTNSAVNRCSSRIHPSYVLRIANAVAAARAYDELVSDLKLANKWLNGQSHTETAQLSQAS
jgi:hypothetical protein